MTNLLLGLLLLLTWVSTAHGQAHVIPTKADPGSPRNGEEWISTTTPLTLKYFDGTTTHGVVDLSLPQTLTNKTESSPVLTGTVTGTYTLGGTANVLSTGSTTARGLADRFAETIDVQDYASFNAAVTAIGSATQTLAVTNIQTVASNVSVPANVTLFFTGAGQLSINTGVTVTLNGPIRAPRQRIFVYNGTGAVSIGHNQREQTVVYPEWWGALNDGATDSQPGVQAAYNAFTGAGVIDFNEGSYIFNSTLTINNKEVEFAGKSRRGTTFFYNGAGGTLISVTLTPDNFYLHDINLDNLNATPGAIGLDLNSERATISRVVISATKGFTTAAIRSGNAGAVFNHILDNVTIAGQTGQPNAIGYHVVAGNALNVRDSHFSGNNVAIRVGSATPTTVDAFNVRGSIFEIFDGTTGPGTPLGVGVDIVNAQGFSIYGNKFEPNASGLLPVQLATCDGGLIMGNFFIGDGVTATAIAASNAACKGVVIEGNSLFGFTGQGISVTNGPLLDIGTNYLGTTTPKTLLSDRDVLGGRQIGRPAYTLQPGQGFSAYAFDDSAVLNKAAAGTHTDFFTRFIERPTVGGGAGALTNAGVLKLDAPGAAGSTRNASLWSLGLTLHDNGIQVTGQGLSVNAAGVPAAGIVNIGTADGYQVNGTTLKNIAETLSNKTIAAPVLSGTATGTYTLGGTPTLTAPTITGVETRPFGFFSGVLTNSSAYTAIASTNVETFFGVAADGKIPAGAINAAKHRIEATFRGIYGVNGATDTITLKAKLCTVSGCGSGTVVQVAATGAVLPGVAVTNQGWETKLDCNVFTAGASGTLDCQGFSLFSLTGLTALQADDMVNTTTVTVDTTVDQYLSLSATWNNNSANNTIQLRNLGVKVY